MNKKNMVPRLMYGVSVDQDFACRCVGRCSYGATLDREVGDMISRNPKGSIPLSQNLGRQFLYMRYNADLSDDSLAKLDLIGSATRIRAMDDTSQMGNLRRGEGRRC